MKTKRQLKKVMWRIAPRVQELTGLRIPTKWGFYKHPKIRWGISSFWDNLHGMYFPDDELIVVSATNGFDPILLPSIVAHEYTHHLQHLHWTEDEWNNTDKLERMAYFVSDHWVPEHLREDIDEVLSDPIYTNR